MSGLMEWLQDEHNPDSREGGRPRWWVLVRLALTGGIVAAFWVYAWPWVWNESGVEHWAVLLILGAYLLVAYFMKPSLDTGDLEWWNLFIDIPFYYQDDIDRTKVYVQIAILLIFLPGIIVTHGIVDFLVMLWKSVV